MGAGEGLCMSTFGAQRTALSPVFIDLSSTSDAPWEENPNSKILFPLSQSEATEMVGTVGFAEAMRFADKFGPPPLATGPAMRIAPSIVTRSEGSLFNLDLPRFAVRMYLNSAHTSFANLRRMNELHKRVQSIDWSSVDCP